MIMMKTISFAILTMILLGCNKPPAKDYAEMGKQSRIIKEMIDAVNEKDADKYVKEFTENVQVYVESELKVNGRSALRKNRENHFNNHPDVRSEIQHLVEIDNKVIMHDKVWLRKSDKIGSDIVEIFTFENGNVVRVDVIQPKDLFNN